MNEVAAQSPTCDTRPVLHLLLDGHLAMRCFCREIMCIGSESSIVGIMADMNSLCSHSMSQTLAKVQTPDTRPTESMHAVP